MENFQFFARPYPIRALIKNGRRVLLALGIGSAVGLLGLLAWSTGNASRYAQQYNVLLVLNGILAATLLVWLVVLIARLARQIWRKQFGARLTARFALFFALIGVLPGSLIYVLSIQFMSRSIESWFNVRVDSALEAGLNLARAALDLRLADIQARARDLAARLETANDAEMAAAIARLRETAGVNEVLVFSGANHIVAFSSATYGQLLPALAPAHVLNQLRVARSYAAVETATTLDQQVAPWSPAAAEARLQFRVILPIVSSSALLPGAAADTRWLQVIQPVPEQIAANAKLVQQGFTDYQELTLSRQGLRELYSITLTLALILTVFAAMVAALALSRRLLRSLLRLAEGTQAVGTGDYRPLPEPKTRDEIGQLTRDFNTMTRQLEDARALVERNREQLQRSNLYLESVLNNLSAGVLVLDADLRVTLSNPGAHAILHAEPGTLNGQALESLAPELTQQIRASFAAHAAVESNRPYWQQQFTLTTSQSANLAVHGEVKRGSPHTEPKAPLTGGGEAPTARSELFTPPQASDTHTSLTLLARGTRLRTDAHSNAYLVVFDDISDVISANRVVAWGEVARRLAHEIKNPLTPIQLSAERLGMKLADRLGAQDAALLQRAVATIVNQVDALKHMVNDFREYARTPPAQMQAVDLNALIGEVLSLYGWEAGSTRAPTEEQPRIELECAADLPAIVGDPTQLRQVLHNLVSNAKDATRQGQARAPTVWVRTRLVQLHAGASAVRLTVQDNGAGFPAGVLARVFEPYMTTKTTGTGLGLAIVHKIVQEHGARIDVENRSEGGARVSILFRRLAAAPDGADGTQSNQTTKPQHQSGEVL